MNEVNNRIQQIQDTLYKFVGENRANQSTMFENTKQQLQRQEMNLYQNLILSYMETILQIIIIPRILQNLSKVKFETNSFKMISNYISLCLESQIVKVLIIQILILSLYLLASVLKALEYEIFHEDTEYLVSLFLLLIILHVLILVFRPTNRYLKTFDNDDQNSSFPADGIVQPLEKVCNCKAISARVSHCHLTKTCVVGRWQQSYVFNCNISDRNQLFLSIQRIIQVLFALKYVSIVFIFVVSLIKTDNLDQGIVNKEGGRNMLSQQDWIVVLSRLSNGTVYFAIYQSMFAIQYLGEFFTDIQQSLVNQSYDELKVIDTVKALQMNGRQLNEKQNRKLSVPSQVNENSLRWKLSTFRRIMIFISGYYQ